MTRRIMVVNPNMTPSMTDAAVTAARAVAGPGTEIVGGTAARGVASVEGNLDEAWAAVAVVDLVRHGEDSGIDGYVIACFGDTGLHPAKELAGGPVVGMTEAALFTAALIAPRFTVVTLPTRTREQTHRVLRETGLAGRCTVRAVEEPVAGVAHGAQHLAEVFLREARLAVAEDGAEAVVLGCAGLSDLAPTLSAALSLPVVEGVAAATSMVEGLLAQALSTSRVSTYAPPAQREPLSW